MMSGSRQTLLPLLAVLALAGGTTGCGGDHEFEPPDRERQLEEASERFTRAVFDTVDWASDSARRVTGEEIFATRCRKCHGYLGRGETDYAARRELDVPSLVDPGWRYAGLPDSTRRHIFVGHQEMPSFGLGRASPRQIDAATYYLLEVLRPELLGDSTEARARQPAGGAREAP